MNNYWKKIEGRGKYELNLKTTTSIIGCMISTVSPWNGNFVVQIFSIVHVS
jgi:hypothetical protein